MSDQDKPAGPVHVGEIMRTLRENAGLTRQQMGAATGIAASTIRNIEMGRTLAHAWTWTRLLKHPALSDLPKLAAEAGLKPPLAT